MLINRILKKYNRVWVWLIVLVSLTSCRDNSRLESALRLAGSNRTELEKVLEYFDGDSLKYEAARFLIENMPQAFGVDSSVVSRYDSFYMQYDSLSSTFYDSLLVMKCDRPEWGKSIDSLWQKFDEQQAWRREFKRTVPDLEVVSSGYLIKEIELAFKAWKENVYTRDASFDDFCEYILPYRRIDGILTDSARQVFYARYGGRFFVSEGKELTDEADSLLYQCRQIVFSGFYGTGIPVYNAATLERLRHGLCGDRCWYNSLLFSSLGMAVAIDFVPSWGHRRNGHSWNVLIKDGQSYAFEPFWDDDRWKYKRIYNNRTFDTLGGRFRLPKVFRNTYRCYVEGPLADKEANMEDIPHLFRNQHKKDVSHEYFDTTNVYVPLRNIPPGTNYAYLCVQDNGNWQPVQWGQIEKGTACFKGMGRDIVYLPMFCVRGIMQPAASPFLLRADGSVQVLDAGSKTREVVTYSAEIISDYRKHYYNIDWMQKSFLCGGAEYNNLSDTLCFFPPDIEILTRKVLVRKSHLVRYVRLHLPDRRLALGSLLFYKKVDKSNVRLHKVKIMQQLPLSDSGESIDNIQDKWSATGYRGQVPAGYIDFDLGEKCDLSHVEFCPYLETGFIKEREYELFYWKEKWYPVGRASGSDVLRFTGVPENALLIVIYRGNLKVSRPFLYEKNEVLWY